MQSKASSKDAPQDQQEHRHQGWRVGFTRRFLVMVYAIAVFLSFSLGRFAGVDLSYVDRVRMKWAELYTGRATAATLLGGVQHHNHDRGSKKNVMDRNLPLPVIPDGKKPPNTVYTERIYDSASEAVRSTNSLLAVCPAAEPEFATTTTTRHNDEHNKDSLFSLSDMGETHATTEEGDYQPVGQHLLVDIDNIDSEFLDSEERLANAMIELVTKSQLTLLSYHCHGMVPAGVSCVGVLLESHVSFHTWPQEGVITLDLFTCGPNSLLPLVTLIQELFAIPREWLSSNSTQKNDATVEGGDDRLVLKPQMYWSHKKRGFPSSDGAYKPKRIEFDRLLGRMTLAKQRLFSTQTDTREAAFYGFEEQGASTKSLHRHVRKPAHESLQRDRLVFFDTPRQSRRFGDSASYYEALVQPAMFTHTHPKKVAIVGGGEGAALREVLKHATVENVVLIEEDELLVNVSQTQLPAWSYCGDLVGSAESCFDDPRVQVQYHNARSWFIDNYSSGGCGENDCFDVVIVETVDSTSSGTFADLIDSEDEAFRTCLFNAVGSSGILVAQIENVDQNQYIPLLQISRVADRLGEVGFASVVDYAELHGRSKSTSKFVVAMKDFESKASWYLSEGAVSLAMLERSMETTTRQLPFLYFDGATMMTYQFPSRIAEDAWCKSGGGHNCQRQHGFDPEKTNAPRESFEIRRSEMDGGGWGVFTKEPITKGSFISLEECVAGMFIPPDTDGYIDEFNYTLDHAYWQTFASYVEGNGWENNYYGGVSGGIDPSFISFFNHGCNGTYNMGMYLPVTESTFEGGEMFINELSDSYVYNPFAERHFPNWNCWDYSALRDIEVGEEVLENYLVLNGARDPFEFEDHARQLRIMCSASAKGDESDEQSA